MVTGHGAQDTQDTLVYKVGVGEVLEGGHEAGHDPLVWTLLQGGQHCSDQAHHPSHCSQLSTVGRAQVSPHPEAAGGGRGPDLGGQGGQHSHQGGEDGLQRRRGREVGPMSDAEDAVTQD